MTQPDEDYDPPEDLVTPQKASAEPVPVPPEEVEEELPEPSPEELRGPPPALHVLPKEPDPRIERTPPHDLEAEASVLGAMLLDPEVIHPVVQVLQPEDFYRESHRRIFAAITELHEGGGGVDALLLREELRRRGDLEAVGGPEALIRLLDQVPTAAHAEGYARVVRGHALRRRLIAYGDRLQRSGFEAIDLDEAGLLVEDGAREYREASATERDEMLSARSIRDMDLPPLVPIVGGELFAKGYYLLVSGPPKLGKSVIALDLALKAAEGEGSWLGQEVSGPLRVLILSAEGGIRLLQKRLRLAASNVPEEVLERIAAPRELARMKFTRPKDLQRLRDMIRRHRADLVIIDPLIRFSGAKERDEDEVEKVCEALAHVRDDLGVAMVLVHHTRKRAASNGKEREATDSADARGSGVWASEADLCLTLEKNQKDRTGKTALTTWESRWEAAPERQVLSIEEGLYVDVAVLANQEPTGGSGGGGGGAGPDPQKVIDCIAQAGPEGATYEALQQATGKSYEVLRKWFRRAGKGLGLRSTKGGTGAPVRWLKAAP